MSSLLFQMEGRNSFGFVNFFERGVSASIAISFHIRARLTSKL